MQSAGVTAGLTQADLLSRRWPPPPPPTPSPPREKTSETRLKWSRCPCGASIVGVLSCWLSSPAPLPLPPPANSRLASDLRLFRPRPPGFFPPS